MRLNEKQNMRKLHDTSGNENLLLGLIFLILVYFGLVVLYDPLLLYVESRFAYVDEFTTFLFLCLALLYLGVNKKAVFFVFEGKMLLLYFGMCILGFSAIMLFKRQDLTYSVFDAIVFSKFLVMYYACRIFFINFNFLKLHVLFRYAAILAVFVVLALVILNKFTHVFPQPDMRFGFLSEELLFGHPSRLAFFSIFTFCIMLPFYKPNLRYNLLFAIIFAIGAVSLRLKCIGFIVIAIIALRYYKKDIRINFRRPRVLFIGLVVLLLMGTIGYQQFFFYYSVDALTSGFARAVLLHNAFVLAFDYFPFGAGFGTFASHYSGVNYSLAYLDLGISGVYGMTPDNPSFISDTFWPMILGQFGFIGLVFFLGIIFFLMKKLIHSYNSTSISKERLLYLSGILLLLSLLIDSTSDAVFTQNRAVAAFGYLAIIVNYSARHQLQRDTT